ncbi:hypothetical protein E1927_13120 [Salmonella enterica subsp. enterica serovar Newport]|uniref:Uncharacterized protein n=1 Tax=Salmonella enterica TaxID=28901 RepID=A0A4Q1JFN1_SALER|nr:hypothetical protein [Salmonella enterica subsp. enterica serovar Newport]MBW5368882.1 hypothetical protein [Salmonella enterica subsp. enterica serovar Heidelberg]NHJ56770.1 hypothetical protein [Salmonella enterica subsp. enterica]RXQ37263.1 hypothetical protein EI538_04695 [Salmonella enterica]NHK10116.1 hypothetical protein [Salmonella enterica subsp. enterica]
MAQSTARARTESLPKSRPIAIAIVLLHPENRYGETVESRGKNRQAGSANLMDKNANALQSVTLCKYSMWTFQP